MSPQSFEHLDIGEGIHLLWEEKLGCWRDSNWEVLVFYPSNPGYRGRAKRDRYLVLYASGNHFVSVEMSDKTASLHFARVTIQERKRNPTIQK